MGTEVLSVDRWLNPVITEHLPADVDFEGGIRRVGSDHRPQEVLLMAARLQASIDGCQFVLMLTLLSSAAPLFEGTNVAFLGRASLLQCSAMSKGLQIPCSRLSHGSSVSFNLRCG